MERSWLHPTEWLTPLLVVCSGMLLLLVFSLMKRPLLPVLQVTAGMLIIERVAWAVHRAWWRSRHTLRDRQ